LRRGESWCFTSGGAGRNRTGQVVWSFALASRPLGRSIRGICAEISPEGKTAQEGAVASWDVAPGTFAPAEDRDVGEAHEALTERGHEGDGEDGVLGKAVRVGQAVADEGDEPHQHVDYGINEEDSELTLDSAAALALGAVAEGGVNTTLGGDAVAASLGYGREDVVWRGCICC
jgi:hypothetical protein